MLSGPPSSKPDCSSGKRHSSRFKLLLHCVLRLLSKLHYLNVAHGKNTACSFNLTLTWKMFCFHKPGGLVFMTLDRHIELLPSSSWLYFKVLSRKNNVSFTSYFFPTHHRCQAACARFMKCCGALFPWNTSSRQSAWRGFWRFGSFFTADQSEGDIWKDWGSSRHDVAAFSHSHSTKGDREKFCCQMFSVQTCQISWCCAQGGAQKTRVSVSKNITVWL